MNQAETIHASWVKRDCMNMSLLDASHADVRDNIQLEVEYKAFLNGSHQGGTGPSIQSQEKRNAAEEQRKAQRLGVELLRNIADVERIRNNENAKSLGNPHDKHNASVTSGPQKGVGQRQGRYRPSRSKVFQSQLCKAQNEKDLIKVKDAETKRDSETCHEYTLRTNSSANYLVKIGQTHSCQCSDFAKNGEKELCKHIIWVLLFICKVPETSELLQQMFLTRTEIYEILCNTTPVENWVKHIEGKRQQNRQEFVANLLQNDRCNSMPKNWTVGPKERKKGPTPRCRSCRKEILENNLCVSVMGLYVPFENNFAVETTFYFCPNVQCIRRIPPWINLTPPGKINYIPGSIEEEEIEHLHQIGLPLQ